MKKSSWKMEIGLGKICPKCNKQTVTIKRIKPPMKKNYFYTQWDFCKPCNAVYFDEQYKSSEWVEAERQQSFFNNLKNENEHE